MNIKTTIVLIVLVSSLLAVYLFVLKGGPGEERPWMGLPLLGDFAADDIHEIIVSDPSGKRSQDTTRLVRDAQGWEISCRSLEEGRPIRAKARVAHTLLDALQALQPLRVVTDPGDDAGLGLDPTSALSIELRGPDMEPRRLRIGASIGAGELACRTNVRDGTFTIGQEVLSSLAIDGRNAADQALLRLAYLDVNAIRVEEAGVNKFEIERGHSRWFLKSPLAGVPADTERCDQLRNAVLRMAIRKRLWDVPPESVVPAPSPWRVTVTDTNGTEHVILLDPDNQRGGLAARVSGQSPAVLASSDLMPLLRRHWGEYRDRRPIGAPSAHIGIIELERPRSRGLTLQRFNQQMFKLTVAEQAPTTVTYFADEVEAGEFLSKLRGLTFLRFDSIEPTFEPEFTIALGLAAPGSRALTRQSIRIGPPDGDERPFKVVGQPGLGFIAGDAVEFLQAPYWTLLERRAKCTDAYFKLGRIELSMADGRSVAYLGRIPGDQEQLVLTRSDEGGAGRLGAVNQTRLLENMTAGVPVVEWLGDQPEPSMGFDAPFMTFRWFEPADASVKSIPAGGEGTWKELILGKRRADGSYFARLKDGVLGLVFLMDPINLPVFTDILVSEKVK